MICRAGSARLTFNLQILHFINTAIDLGKPVPGDLEQSDFCLQPILPDNGPSKAGTIIRKGHGAGCECGADSWLRLFITHRVEARYLLTPRTMERLLELRVKLGHVEVSFVGSRVCIAAPGFPYIAFEPNVSRPFTDAGQISQIFGMLLLVIGIVEDLDLNTRIWTKR